MESGLEVGSWNQIGRCFLEGVWSRVGLSQLKKRGKGA